MVFGRNLLMGEYTKRFDRIEECYIPGTAMPPVKDEWRFASSYHIWKSLVTGIGEKPKKYAPFKSRVRPEVSGNVISICVNKQDEEPRCVFIPFSELTISKYVVKTMYKLISDDDEGVLIAYKELEPIAILDTECWYP
jgi:hypothetical protein